MKNKLFYGDNLDNLHKYIENESVDLCYIDPPFNSDENYNQTYSNKVVKDKAQAQAFIDTWTWNTSAMKAFGEITKTSKEHEFLNQSLPVQAIHLIIGLEKVLGQGGLLAYLVSMTQRIGEIHRVLKPTGSFYLHCDPTASHYLKLILDAIFCTQGGVFKNEIVWKRYAVHSLSTTRYDSVSDIIFLYSKSAKAGTFKLQYENSSEEEMKKRFPHVEKETERRFQHVALEQTSNGSSKGEIRIIQGKEVRSSLGWRWTQKTFDERLAKNPYIIHWTGTGRPRYKIYADEYAGKPLGNIWTDVPYLSAGDKERLGYPTQKPEALLERIIKASSNEGDVVLDCYCGCGTTIAVAEKLKRKWIGIDITYQSISLILKRLEDSFDGDFTKDLIDKDSKEIIRPARLQLSGVPQDFKGAVALANKEDDRLRKEFEKWFVLTFANNRAVINDKKGGDGGIDGTAFMFDTDDQGKQDLKQIIFSVKSNKVLSPTVLRDLNGTIEREKAVMGYLLTLYPMPNLVKDATKYGTYQNKMFGHEYPKIEVISVQELFDGRRLSLPIVDVLKKAEQKTQKGLDMFDK